MKKKKEKEKERKKTKKAIRCALEMLCDKEYPENKKAGIRRNLLTILAWARENDPDFLPAKKVGKILAEAGMQPPKPI